MKTVKTIRKAAVLALLLFIVLFIACQNMGSVKRNSALKDYEAAALDPKYQDFAHGNLH